MKIFGKVSSVQAGIYGMKGMMMINWVFGFLVGNTSRRSVTKFMTII